LNLSDAVAIVVAIGNEIEEACKIADASPRGSVEALPRVRKVQDPSEKVQTGSVLPLEKQGG